MGLAISENENFLSPVDENKKESLDSLLTSPMTPFDSMRKNPHSQMNNDKRRRESSIMLQQRLGQQDHDEILSISHSILSLHRKHMSDLMDALREEMDLISIFESNLLEDSKPQNRVKNGILKKKKLDEDQVLKYYEKVLLCLD